MTSIDRVAQRMLRWRAVAATDVAAGRASPQVEPPAIGLEALHAAFAARSCAWIDHDTVGHVGHPSSPAGCRRVAQVAESRASPSASVSPSRAHRAREPGNLRLTRALRAPFGRTVGNLGEHDEHMGWSAPLAQATIRRDERPTGAERAPGRDRRRLPPGAARERPACSPRPGSSVVGQACRRARSCCVLVRRVSSPDVAIVDIRMPPTLHRRGPARGAPRSASGGGDGTGVLVLSHHVEPAFALRLLARRCATGPATCSRTGWPTSRTSPMRCGASPRGGSVVDPAVVARAGAAAPVRRSPSRGSHRARARGPGADGRRAARTRPSLTGCS